MILDNGSRSSVYSDGQGGAYTVVNGQQVQLARDNNGNWVQLDPMQNQQVAPQVSQPQVVYVNPNQNNGLGFWGWIGVLGTVVVVGFILLIVLK
jgi:hypothetical protein